MYLSRKSKAVYWLYTIYLACFWKSINSKNLISPRARLIGLKGIIVAENNRIEAHSRLEIVSGRLKIGNNNRIYRYSQILAYGGTITIGSFNSVHPYVSITGPGHVTIGSYVRIAPGVVIVAGSHIFEDSSVPIHNQGMRSKGITIEDDVWIGTKATILDGVTIAKGSVIGANCVVTKDTKPYEVYVGVPAKSIGRRS